MFLRCKAQSAAKVSFKQTIRPFKVSFFMGGVGGREPNFIHRNDISLNTEKAFFLSCCVPDRECHRLEIQFSSKP